MARILIVDDQEDIRLALSMTLQDAGHAVFEASSGEDAIEEAIVTQPDLVLMDIAMPGLDGFSALQALKEQPATHSTPVLMLTAMDRTEQRERARVLGAFDFITKPWAKGEVELRAEWAIAAGGDPARRVCVHPDLDPVAA